VNTTLVRENLAEKFRNKEYRDAFVAEQIFSRLPLKIRNIREEQGLTQKQLGELADMAQAWVSKLEDPNYGKLTISTLLKLASALDVGLSIDFVPFSRVLDGAVRLRASSFCVPKFVEDKGFSYTLSEHGASNACLDGAESEPLQFPVRAVVSNMQSALTPPQSASSIVHQEIA
jgi:transcriptional regulator with XRE-family HTH domain